MTTGPSRIAFLCSAGGANGYGHLRRSLTLAESLDRASDILFFVSLSGNTLPFADDLAAVAAVETFSTVTAALHAVGNANADILILDTYETSPEQETSLAGCAAEILVIEDRPGRAHPAATRLLDPTLGRKRSDYDGIASESCACFLGPRYALIRPEFSRHVGRERGFAVSGTPRILIAFGGTDPIGATPKVMAALAGLDADISAVLGSGAGCLEDARAVARQYGMTLHTDLSGAAMADLMRRADLCIGAGGGTAWERCTAGVPTITYRIAENQTDVLSGLGDAGAIAHAGDIQDATPEDILASVSALLADPGRRMALVQAGRTVCDGFGARRIAAYLTGVAVPSGANIRLRPAAPGDCRVVFDWQVEPDARRYARNPAVPDWAEHEAWFFSRLDRIGAPFLIVECDGNAAGFVRFDRVDNDGMATFEAAIMISRDYAGRGIATAALRHALSVECPGNVVAEVHPDNAASRRLFEKAGFVQTDVRHWTWRREPPENHGAQAAVKGPET